MPEISIINIIDVPAGSQDQAIAVRERYANFFRAQPGFVGSTFFRASDPASPRRYINIVVWDSNESYEAVVAAAADGDMKVLGDGFPEPIAISPGRYEIIGT
jgi:heme-degrading monooxygenase HmoA